MTLSGATTLCQRGVGTDGSNVVLPISQSFSMTRISPSDCLMLYLGHSLGESYPFAKMCSEYSAATANWFTLSLGHVFVQYFCNIPDKS